MAPESSRNSDVVKAAGRNRFWRLAIPVLLAAAFAGMLTWSWGAWPDALVDFGRELYTPWQLTQGKVLYRDVQSFYGPLSPYVNALWFEFFGINLRTLALCNAALLAVFVWLLFHILEYVGSRMSAAVACLVFILIFGFSQYAGIGNYNYICPYAHEAVHGVMLTVGSMFCLMRYQQRQSLRWLAGCGFILGLVFLTKPEAFLAAFAGIGTGLLLQLAAPSASRRRAPIAIPLAFACAIIPVLTAFSLLCTTMPASAALRGTLGSWPFLLDHRLTSLPFFEQGMGTDHPIENIVAMAIGTYWYIIIFLPVAIAAIGMPQRKVLRMTVAGLGLAAAAIFCLATRKAPAWFDVARPLPIFMTGSALIAGIFWRKTRCDPQLASRHAFQTSMALLALMYMTKMILNAQIAQYGFVLAMPATMLAVIALIDWIPSWIQKWGGAPNVFHGSALGMVGGFIVIYVLIAHGWMSIKTLPLGSGADAFRTDPYRGPYIKRTLEWIEHSTQPSDTVAVAPEGVMFNYLARRSSSLTHLTFLPSDFIMFGEDHLSDEMRAKPPDYIVLAHRDTSEYGPQYFGQDYGQAMYAWIQENYRQVHLEGQPPLHDGTLLGFAVMKRNGLGR